MAKVKILVDSLSGLSPSMAQELGIELISYYCSYGGKSYKDGLGFDRAQFYTMLRTIKGEYPTTSHPSLHDLTEAYWSACKEAESVIHLVVSSQWTKTYELALKAKSEFPKKRIEVVDTEMAIGSLCFLALEAVKAAEERGSIEAVLRRVAEVKPRVNSAVVFETLKYLARGGRIGKAQALLGSVLSIRPIIGFKDGIAIPLAKVMTQKQGLDWIVAKIRADIKRLGGEKIQLIIEDIDNREWANRAKERLGKEFLVDKLYENTASVVIGTHVGPGSWGVSWFVL